MNLKDHRRGIAAVLTVGTLSVGGLVFPDRAAAASTTFSYTGAAQSYTVPAGVTQLSVDVKGAAGGPGSANSATVGQGGEAQGTLTVTPGQILQVNVGGVGSTGVNNPPNNPVAGGWNGGGAGLSGNAGNGGAGGGGGASDIRDGTGGCFPACGLGTRLAVAGGGGGAPAYNSSNNAGAGGGSTGGNGICTGCNAGGGGGGTQIAGGAAGTATPTATPGTAGVSGQGGAGGNWGLAGGGGGGGGGGYFGGGGGGGGYNGVGAPGGGGSAFGPGGFTLTSGVQSGNGVVTLTPATSAPAITSAASTTFTVGSAGTFSVTTTGSPTPSISDGGATLPSGVTFVDNANGTATLAGTPGAGTGGTYPFTITANNGVSPNATQSFTLTVDQAPAITSATTTTFAVGTAGTFSVTTTGFPSGPTLTLSDGGATLPSGVTFVDNGNGTATLTGTPGAGTAGTYPFTITANNGVSPNATQSFTLTVAAQGVTLTLTANPTTVVAGNPVTFTATVAAQSGGGTPTGTVSFSGASIAGCQNVALAGGVATCTTSSLPVGSDPVTATYSGDGTFASGVLGITVTVTSVPIPATGAATPMTPALPWGILLVALGGAVLWRARRPLAG